MTTKEQERKVLAQIRKLVEGLGEDSYVGTALEGCWEIAEQNIENDWACSMKQRAESAENRIEVQAKDIERLTHLKEHLEKSRAEAQEKAAQNFQEALKYADKVRTLEALVQESEQAGMDQMAIQNEKDSEIEELKLEIIKLKARLFDLMNL